MAAERLTWLPEQTASPFSLKELPPERVKSHSEELFRFSHDRLIGSQDFKTALRSDPPTKGIPIGNFEFKIQFDGRNYKYIVSLENGGKNKKLKLKRSFDFSHNGPTITEELEVKKGDDPSFSYLYEVSDDPKEKLEYRNNLEAEKQIKLFFFLL